MKKTYLLSIIIILLIFILIFSAVFFQKKSQSSSENIPQLKETPEKITQEKMSEEEEKEEIVKNNSFALPDYQTINEKEKENLASILINSDYQSIMNTFPQEKQSQVAAFTQLIIVRIMQTNNNVEWWKNLFKILQEQNLLYNFGNFDYNQLLVAQVVSSRLTDSEFSAQNNSGVINQDLIFISDVQFIQNDSQVIDAQLVWTFNIDCPPQNECHLNYNQLPYLIKAN